MSDAGGFEMMVQGLQTATTIAKELLGHKLSRDVSAKIFEMNAVILSTQSSALTAQAREMELADRVRKLEEEVVHLKDWDVQKDNYELQCLAGTAFAYTVKEGVEASGPPHWLCQPCFEISKKSVLQMRKRLERGFGVWGCSVCNAEIRVAAGTHPG